MLGCYPTTRPGLDLPEHNQIAIKLVAQIGIVAAYFHRARTGQSLPPIRKDLGEAAHFLWLMTGEEPGAEAVRTLDVAYVLHAEHGFNASTFTGRVVASTLSDMYSAVSAAIGALKGPLHGGANEGVIHMLQEIGSLSHFVSGDAAALKSAREAKVLVATARSLATLAEGRVELDALVRSRSDEGETYRPGDMDPPPRADVATAGPHGGTFTFAGGAPTHFPPASAPGPLQDTYGAGDSFAAGLTFGLAEGLPMDEAVALAARSGAAALSRRGAHGA